MCVEQPPRFESSKFLNHVLKIHKVVYGLKQALRAQYEPHNKFLSRNDFTRGKIDKTLFITTKRKDFLIIHVYVNETIFCAANNVLCQEFFNLMSEEFKMSIKGELNFLLGLQIKQC